MTFYHYVMYILVKLTSLQLEYEIGDTILHKQER